MGRAPQQGAEERPAGPEQVGPFLNALLQLGLFG